MQNNQTQDNEIQTSQPQEEKIQENQPQDNQQNKPEQPLTANEHQTEYPFSSYGTLPPKTAKVPKPVPVSPKLNTYQLQFKSQFSFYGQTALAIGILAAFCFYHNPNAVTYPVFLAAVYLSAYKILPALGISIKKDSVFLAAAAFILSVNSCITASPILHKLNTTAQLLLGSIFFLHQCYPDQNWNIGKYIHSIICFWIQALFSLPLPFSYASDMMKHLKKGKNQNILLVLAGFLAAIPAVIYLGYLLADADIVFGQMIETLVFRFFNPYTLFSVILFVFFSALAVCCFLGSICSMNIPDIKEKKKTNPLSAISFTAMITLLYLLFCIVQVVFLFAKKGSLPEGITYSQYARKGFFQLLAVVMVNLIFVLNCLKYFRKHKILTALLTVFSICTYIMIASAVYRMILYVDAYHLTFLRLFVLWFLGLLAVLMAGVVILLFRENFPLFRWCLLIITLAYCGFACSLPDYHIARYNLAREEGKITLENADYLISSSLCADAAPVIAAAEIDPQVTYGKLYYCSNTDEENQTVDKIILISSLDGIPWNYTRINANRLTKVPEQIETIKKSARKWKPGIRTYNFSLARAKKMAEQCDNPSINPEINN